jgi:hypothetical protein
VVRGAPAWCKQRTRVIAEAACRRGDAAHPCIGTNLALSIAEREWSGAPDATHHNPKMDD